MDPLKLIAFDAEDLNVVSAHLQDAVIRVGDMAYLPRQNRFAMALNRFDWALAEAKEGKELVRRRAALRFERVTSARTMGFDRSSANEVLVLLAVAFEPKSTEDPAGSVTLTFSGGASVRLDVECLEAELRDLGGAWKAASLPRHPAEDGPEAAGS